MSDETKELMVRISATTELLRSQLSTAERALAKFESGAGQASQRVNRHFDVVNRAATGLQTTLRGLGAALVGGGIVVAGQKFLAIADEASKLTAQLKLATAQSGSFAQAQADVRRIAEATRSGLAETTTLYASFARSSAELGISQEQVARITETVGKAFKVSGAGASESANGIRQLSQAFASGVLRGDEFNSIMENAPRLARLLADSLGVPVGALRAMAEEGQLTADKLVSALSDQKFTAGLDAEFRELPVTFDDAMTQVSNAALVTFGAFDRGGQFSTTLSNFVSDGASGFKDLENAALEFGINTRAEIAALASAFGPVIRNVSELLGLMNGVQASSGPMFAKLAGELDYLNEKYNQIRRFMPFVPNSGPATTGMQDRQMSAWNRSQARSRGDAAYAEVSSWLKNYDVLGNPIAAGPAPRAMAGGGGGGGGRIRAGGSSLRRSGIGAGGRSSRSRSGGEPYDWASEAVQAFEVAMIEMDSALQERLGKSWDGSYEEAVKTAKNIIDFEFAERQQMLEKVRSIEENQVRFLSGLFENAFRGGTAAIWRDFKEIGLAVIAQLMAKFAIAKASGGAFSFGGALTSVLGSVLGFADGGRPPLGRVSVVGERGPELFVPDVAGTIIPNHAIGGGGAPVVNIYAPGATAETVAMIRREIAAAAPTIVSAASSNTQRQLGRRRL